MADSWTIEDACSSLVIENLRGFKLALSSVVEIPSCEKRVGKTCDDGPLA